MYLTTPYHKQFKSTISHRTKGSSTLCINIRNKESKGKQRKYKIVWGKKITELPRLHKLSSAIKHTFSVCTGKLPERHCGIIPQKDTWRTHPAHGTKALVNPHVPLTGSQILAFFGQGFVAPVVVWSSQKITKRTQGYWHNVHSSNTMKCNTWHNQILTDKIWILLIKCPLFTHLISETL